MEKEKTKDKSNKECNLILSKIVCPCDEIVVDYADTCWKSRWLRGHDVGIVIDYNVGVVVVYTDSDRHCVGVVVDYVDNVSL